LSGQSREKEGELSMGLGQVLREGLKRKEGGGGPASEIEVDVSW